MATQTLDDTIWFSSVETMRGVEWNRGHLWDIRFPDGPSAFSDWFPATDVEENVWSLTTHELQAGHTSIEIPKGTSVFTLSITFVDSVKCDVEHWLTEWVNDEILTDGRIGLLTQICKQVDIKKLNPDKTVNNQRSYMVFPKDEMFFKGTSDDESHQESVNFVIAETL